MWTCERSDRILGRADEGTAARHEQRNSASQDAIDDVIDTLTPANDSPPRPVFRCSRKTPASRSTETSYSGSALRSFIRSTSASSAVSTALTSRAAEIFAKGRSRSAFRSNCVALLHTACEVNSQGVRQSFLVHFVRSLGTAIGVSKLS